MKSRINILFLLVVYLLNVAHDIQPHTHTKDFVQTSENIFLNIFGGHHHDMDHHHSEHHKHNEQHQDSEHNSENGETELPVHETGLPFSHKHINQVHDNYQIRIFQNTIEFKSFYKTPEINFSLKPPEIIPEKIILHRSKIFYQGLIRANLSLRAPPFYS